MGFNRIYFVGVAEGIYPYVHVARRGDFGVQLPHATGAGVPRVGIEGFASLRPLFVKSLKLLDGQVDFAAHFETRVNGVV